MGSRTGFTDNREQEVEAAPQKGILRDYVEVFLVCVLFIIFVRTFVFQQSEIPSGSMEDSILIGDYILVNRFSYAPTSFDWERKLLPVRDVRLGDVVVFKNPETPERDFIKRVVGLPGDAVELRAGHLFVNGELIDEPYLNPLYRQRSNFGPVVVEPDHYFMMGDHRNLSRDSREWGQASTSLLKGQAFMILFSTQTERPGTRPSETVTLKRLVLKIYNLVFHSRWDRAFRLIR